MLRADVCKTIPTVERHNKCYQKTIDGEDDHADVPFSDTETLD